MKRLPNAILLLLAVLSAGACKDLMGIQTGCDVAPGEAFAVTTRDQNGTGQALGAVMIFHDDSTGRADSASTIDDTLTDYGGVQNRFYDIQVTKRYYSDGWARHLRVVSDKCGLGFSRITIPIGLIAGSPPIRTMNMLPRATGVDPNQGQPTVTFRPFLDADPSVSRAMRWTITGDSTAATFDPATATLTYHCQPLNTRVVVRATLLADSTFSDSSVVTVVGHPFSAIDQTCR
jgi:hypothetical protein